MRKHPILFSAVFALGCVLGILLVAEEKEEPNLIDKLASELPRVKPKSPEESLKAIEINKSFQVQIVATEPLIHDPVAMDFDEFNRMFVVQLPQYNAYAVEGFKGRGSIAMLEDTDDDGRYDKSTVYADDLDYPTAVACWDGGLFVGASPDLLYIKDTDGDGKADTRKVVFTGFGKDKAGEAHLNSFRWGLDNRFHISTNLSGGDVRVASDKNSKPVSVRGRGLIFDPRDLSKFELTSGGGQHGMSMDDWGTKFVCSNSVPAQMLMYDDRYLVRNPQVRAPATAVDIAPDGKFTRLFRITPPEPWRELRTRLRKDGKFRGSDEGGKPFGFFTGATGITIYRGDAWGENYRNNLLVGDVANNLIYRAELISNGPRLVAHRADKDAEFLASRDIWFRPVQMANAPDGNLYFLDIYRELIEGAAFLPPEFMKYLDPIGGNDRGRIYRIARDHFQPRKLPKLGEMSIEQLVSALGSMNGWTRDTAARLLYQRQDSKAIEGLRDMARQAVLPEGRVTALHSLVGLDGLDEETLLHGLNDKVGFVRRQAVRLAEQFADSPVVAAELFQMTKDGDLIVRYQLAFSLGEFRGRVRDHAIATMVINDGTDSWFRLASLSSLVDGAGNVFSELSRKESFRKSKHGGEFLSTLAEQIGTVNRSNEIAVVLKTLQGLPETEKALAEKLVQSLVKNQKGVAREKILRAADGKAAEFLKSALTDAKNTAGDVKKPILLRVSSIKVLRLDSFADVAKLLANLLDSRQASDVQLAALETLGEFTDDQVVTIVLSGWRGYSPSVRAKATETLLSRPAWINQFLDAVKAGKVKRGDVDPARVALLKKHPTRAIAERATKLFGTTLSKRVEVVARYRPALKREGDAARGKMVFKKVCSSCHRLENVGTQVGEDLKAIRNRGISAVMLNILDPNREVKPQFLSYVLLTADGKTITGMIESENANSLTIRRPDGTKIDIQRAAIDELTSTGLSFMPEGLEKQLTIEAMADLLSYLDSIR